uniref:Uncharacterized protein n=1 Tax=Moniliophthora roreri TaxID=221103 RepID=A0A0W0FHP8_MONRR
MKPCSPCLSLICPILRKFDDRKGNIWSGT